MNKPDTYEQTRVAGEFEPILLGGHRMVIKQVAEKQSKSGLKMLVVLFDFAEDDRQPGYFMKQFEDDIRPEKKYPNAGTNYMIVDESTDYGVRNLKTFNTCVEKSNDGFQVAWGDKYCQQFKGKKIGGVFRVEKDWYNGKEVKHHKFAWFRSISKIDEAEVPQEVTTKAYDAHLRDEAIASGTDFINIPEGADDEIPFN